MANSVQTLIENRQQPATTTEVAPVSRAQEKASRASNSQAGKWWRDPFTKEIIIVLIIKFMLIFALWWMFFDLPESQRITAPQFSTHVYGNTPVMSRNLKENAQ